MNIVSKKAWTLFFGIFILGTTQINGQIRWDAVIGGGYSDLEIPFKGFGSQELLTGSILAEVGTSLSGDFRKDGMAGWQLGFYIQNTGFRSIPVDKEKLEEIFGDGPIMVTDKTDFPRDYSNAYLKRNWGVTAPVSFTFYVFHPVRLLAGAEFNYMLSDFPEKDKHEINNNGNLNPRFKDFNIAGHLGLFVDISSKVRIQGKIFSDFEPRLNYHWIGTEDIDKGYYRIGFSVDMHYRVN